jgi:Ca2+-transporting ATPase
MLVGWSAMQGLVAVALLVLLVGWGSGLGVSDEQLRSIAFAGLCGAVVVLVLINRAFATALVQRPRFNPTLALILLLVAGTLALLFGSPFFADLFRFALLDPRALVAVPAMMAALYLLLALLKRRFRRSLSA